MGVSAEAQNSDMSVAFTGGQTFIDRLEQLSAAKAAAEQAEASLNLSMSAKAAMDAVDGQRAEADRILADAKTQAQKVLAEATSQVESVISDTKAKVEATTNAAAALRAAAEVFSEETRSAAQAAALEASKKLSDAEDVAQLAQATLDGHVAKSAALDAAISAAKTTEARYSAALKIIKDAAEQALKV